MCLFASTCEPEWLPKQISDSFVLFAGIDILLGGYGLLARIFAAAEQGTQPILNFLIGAAIAVLVVEGGILFVINNGIYKWSINNAFKLIKQEKEQNGETLPKDLREILENDPWLNDNKFHI